MSDAQPQSAVQIAVPVARGFDAAGALTQVGSALGGILLVIIIVAWLVRKLGLAPAAKQSQRLTLQASCSLGPRERVVVVEVEGTWLVLGVTAQNITPLHSLPAPAADADANARSAALAGDFRQRLRLVMRRTGKDQ
ncbi:flagellar biosynthetic protein FliO [Sodalis sp. RH15]|uniref:flagellar biosynthetic protein FliO n=1 Tax=Sodalis sp. RH15 TaxID=3394330 RepID=UPI0039B53943